MPGTTRPLAPITASTDDAGTGRRMIASASRSLADRSIPGRTSQPLAVLRFVLGGSLKPSDPAAVTMNANPRSAGRPEDRGPPPGALDHHPPAKLYGSGSTVTELAATFGCSRPTIYSVLEGSTSA